MNDPTQAFWDDLNHNLADPEFRAAYEKERLAMSTADLIAEARKRVTTLRSADIESQSEVLLWRLADALEASVTQSHVSDVVTTVAELDALHVETLIRDSRGDFFKRSECEPGLPWTKPGSPWSYESATIGLPATVLWVGGTE